MLFIYSTYLIHFIFCIALLRIGVYKVTSVHKTQHEFTQTSLEPKNTSDLSLGQYMNQLLSLKPRWPSL